MPKEYPRKIRVAESIKRLLAEPLAQAARDGGLGMLTVTDVDVASDMSNATVYVSAFGTSASREQIMGALRELRGDMRQRIARDLRMKKVPTVHFALDDSIATGARISELLAKRSEE
jgi:ribosome-binding factor A